MPLSRPKLLAIAALLAAVALGIWFSRSSETHSAEHVAATRTELVQAVYATGTVEPVRWAMLSPDRTGRLVDIIHNEGDTVNEGDIVARMESRVVEERLREAQERLAYAEKEAVRHRRLVKSGAISRSMADNTEREYGEAKARAQALQRELADLTLTAPMSGVVLRRDVELGETVQAGESAFWVGSPTPLRITAEVDEEDIGQVRLGQTALIKADAFPNDVFKGTVDEITPQGDPVNKVFRVRIGLPADSPLMINMTTEVNIVIQTLPDALVIPLESERNGTVWRVDGRNADPAKVKTGIRNETHVQILEGLNEGDTVLKQPPN